MRKTLTRLAPALILVLASSQASAINYVEGTDLPNSYSFAIPPGVSVGTLTPGGNTISGALDGVCSAGNCNSGAGSGDSQDSFLFTMSLNNVVASMSVTTHDVSAPAGFAASLLVRYSPGDSSQLQVLTLPINGSAVVYSGASWGPGTYSVSILGRSAGADGAYHVGWDVSLQLPAVPEVPSAGLMALGLPGLAWLRRRRVSAART
jgi:hypothetical protein